jgi:hypothetical protein
LAAVLYGHTPLLVVDVPLMFAGVGEGLNKSTNKRDSAGTDQWKIRPDATFAISDHLSSVLAQDAASSVPLPNHLAISALG